MDIARFNAERDKILSLLPPEFRGFVVGQTSHLWNEMRAEAVLEAVAALTDDLAARIHDYSCRIARGECA